MGIIDRLFGNSNERGKPVQANQLNFSSLLESSRYVVVDFWGKNCPPCEAMDPIVKKLAKEYEGRVLFLKVNTASNPELSSKFKVKSVPAFLFFENSRLKGRRVGAMRYEVFKKWIDSMIA